MRKMMLLTAMLAMVLMAAVPALAQDVQYTDDDVDAFQQVAQACQAVTVDQDQYVVGDDEVVATIGDVNITVGDCTQIVQQIAAGDDAAGAIEAVTGADFTPETPVEVVVPVPDDDDNGVDNGNGVADDDDNGAMDDDDNGVADDGAMDDDDNGDDNGMAMLPDTGGASLLALGAGALLVAGGLLARRIVR